MSGHSQEAAFGEGVNMHDMSCSRDETCVLISLATAHATSPLGVPVRSHTGTCVCISYVPAQSVYNTVQNPYSNVVCRFDSEYALTAAGLVVL